MLRFAEGAHCALFFAYFFETETVWNTMYVFFFASSCFVPTIHVVRIDDAERPRRTDRRWQKGCGVHLRSAVSMGMALSPRTTDNSDVRRQRTTAIIIRRTQRQILLFIACFFCLFVCWWCDGAAAAVPRSLLLVIALSITKRHDLLPCTTFTWISSAKHLELGRHHQYGVGTYILDGYRRV